MGLDARNRLDIDYKKIERLERIVDEVEVCMRRKDWKKKEELEKEYFEIYDSLDRVHRDYIEQKKRYF